MYVYNILIYIYIYIYVYMYVCLSLSIYIYIYIRIMYMHGHAECALGVLRDPEDGLPFPLEGEPLKSEINHVNKWNLSLNVIAIIHEHIV